MRFIFSRIEQRYLSMLLLELLYLSEQLHLFGKLFPVSFTEFLPLFGIMLEPLP